MQAITIDDVSMPVRRPESVAEVCALVKEAAGAGQGVYPVGGRKTLDVGLPPIKPGFALDTTALNQVIDYPARDMTITVQAGITIAKLQETLAAEGQWLPIDVPNPERATLGGAIALNLSGPRRFGYGTFRDYVIGISFVTDEGDEVKAGGRVVKNVAGYDLMKLQVGAVGTLGVITQVTLKVKPKPGHSILFSFGCASADLAAVLDLLHRSKSRPCAVELLNGAAWRATGIGPMDYRDDWIVAVGLEEKGETVEWQRSTLWSELETVPVRGIAEFSGLAASRFWSALIELQRRPGSPLIWKANVPPSRVADLAREVTARIPCEMHSEAMNGIVWFHVPEGLHADPDNSQLSWFEQQVTSAGGNFAMHRCPSAWKRRLPVWGKPSPDRDLMRQVKLTLDPKNVFNPGRLFGDV